MNAICLVTKTPTNEWCEYLNKFTTYKNYILVDDNNFDYTLYKTMFQNLFFIKFQHESYKVNGYTNTQFDNTAWDKALYYFAVENTTHAHVWFIDASLEKKSEQQLINADKNHEKIDLLYNRYSVNMNGYKGYWLWEKINLKYVNPFYNADMMPARMSHNMLSKINEYASIHKELFYIEALLPTISIKNGLEYMTPEF